MSKRNTFKKTAALALSIALLTGSSACGFFPTNNEKDLKQTVADVNISASLAGDDKYSAHADSVKKLIESGDLNSKISKSDLVAAFLSTGYTYVESYGYSYEDTFNMLMDSLVSRTIVTQYAVAYYLGENEALSMDGLEAFVNGKMEAEKEADSDRKAVLRQVYTLEYFITENGADYEDYNYAVYQLKSSINASLDSWEQTYIKAEDEEHNHAEARTTPTNVGTEKEDYYPTKEDGSLDYDVYTGRNALDSCGEYEKVENSTTATRQRAYNAFLANLQESNLISEDDNTAKFTDLDYYYVELTNSLEQALISKYGDDLQEEAVQDLKENYIEGKYEEIKNDQAYAYEKDASAFETALGSVSDDSFVLHGKEGFGFVYNILIPFSAAQEQAYSAAKSKGLTENELFTARKDILSGVLAKDLRTTWFDAHDHASKAYEATEADNYYDNKADKGEKVYLFFEDNMNKTSQYETLRQYAGKYPYNGKAELVDEKYEFTPNKMNIDAFMTEMESYINAIVGSEVASGKKIEKYETTTDYYKSGKKDVDYSNFMYYEGKVALSDTSAANFFNPESDQYKALSAVNELMFAYSTDTGCLNTYMGYVVSPHTTSFVPEFEYAAQYAVSQGVGSYVVCATDYGWHIVYTTFVYEADGDVYGGYKAEEKDTEGTFSNLFYESLKATLANTHINEVQNDILTRYHNDDSVTLYKSAYKDLLEIQAQ